MDEKNTLRRNEILKRLFEKKLYISKATFNYIIDNLTDDKIYEAIDIHNEEQILNIYRFIADDDFESNPLSFPNIGLLDILNRVRREKKLDILMHQTLTQPEKQYLNAVIANAEVRTEYLTPNGEITINYDSDRAHYYIEYYENIERNDFFIDYTYDFLHVYEKYIFIKYFC